MALTPQDIDRLDKEAANKAALEKALHAHAKDYPALLEITEDRYKRDEMVEEAKRAVAGSDELSDDDKRAAFEKLARKQPEAVLIPVRNAFLILRHPRMQRETFTITVFESMGMKFVESYRKPRTIDNQDVRPEQPQIRTTAVEEVPSWAIPKVYDLIESGDLKLFPSAKDAQQAVDESLHNHRSVLSHDHDPIAYRLQREGRGISQEYQSIVSRPTGKFTKPEHQAAWNVLNKTIGGELPIPTDTSEVNPDPSDVTQAELSRVETRIRRCLDRPEAYVERRLQSEFDDKAFLSQLLHCEMKGWTPQRGPRLNTEGGMRLPIVLLIRSIAKERGYDVIGDSVRERPADALASNELPATEPMRA